MKYRIRKFWGKNVLGKVENNIIIQILNANKKGNNKIINLKKFKIEF